MSAIGPKRTSPVAPHMSAFGDMTFAHLAPAVTQFLELYPDVSPE